MDDDTFQRELYERMSTAARAADTLWVIGGSLADLKEKLNPKASLDKDFLKCLGAIDQLAQHLKT